MKDFSAGFGFIKIELSKFYLDAKVLGTEMNGVRIIFFLKKQSYFDLDGQYRQYNLRL